MCRGTGVSIRRRDRTGGRASIRAGITTARGIVNVTPIHGEEMFQDQIKAQEASFRIARLEGENAVSELVNWCRNNLDELTVQCFTHKRFVSVQALVDALCEVYRDLGVEGDKGNVSSFVLFLAGKHRDKIYASHEVELNDTHRQILRDKLGLDIEEIEQGLSKLDLS